jgi:hypothetical protein
MSARLADADSTVSVNVATGTVVLPVSAAVTVTGPAVAPGVSFVAVATPEASVVAIQFGEAVPEATPGNVADPDVTVNVTDVDGIGLPYASTTRTDSGVEKGCRTVAAWASPTATEMSAAAPAPP